MDKREKDIQNVCYSVMNHQTENTHDSGSGGQCPFCYKECSHRADDVSEIEHELDCIVLIARDLSTNFKAKE